MARPFVILFVLAIFGLHTVTIGCVFEPGAVCEDTKEECFTITPAQCAGELGSCCPESCGFCGSQSPTPTPSWTPSSFTLPPNYCEDLDELCPSSSEEDCANVEWAYYCPYTCGRCSTPTPTPTPTHSILPSPTELPCVGMQTDVCIAADGSTSLGRSGWMNQARFIKKMIKGVDKQFPSQPKIRFGGNIFGTGIYDQLGFRSNGSFVYNWFLNAEYKKGWTRIDKALKKCRKQLENSGRDASDWVVVLITDGNARKPGNVAIPQADLMAEADAIKALGARVYTVGYGDDGYEDVLRDLSGNSSGAEVYYSELESVTDFKAYAAGLIQYEDNCRA